MKAELSSMLELLGRPDSQFQIPVFQRVYSWNSRSCEQLWQDMANSQNEDMLFMGTLIYLPDGNDGKISKISLIDGQQRLTTLTLILIALRDALLAKGDEQSADLASKINNVYLHAAPGACKLVLSDDDRDTLFQLIDKDASIDIEEPSKLLRENIDLFRDRFSSSVLDATSVMEMLGSLKVVAVELGPDDSPQQVFESLNSKGSPLSTTDLIRNTLIVEFGEKAQEDLFAKYWEPIDEVFYKFGSEQDIYLDAALHYWISKTSSAVFAAKREDLYHAFKVFISGRKGVELEDMLASISEACLEFAENSSSSEMRAHIDWAVDKPKGLISQRKIFGD